MDKPLKESWPQDRLAKRKMLLDRVESIAEVLRASGAKSEELGTLAPEAVQALKDTGLFRLKLAAELGGAEADPVTEMMVIERLGYHDLTSGWCTMIGATSIASIGGFLPQAGIDRVFVDGHIPTASFSFFPGGRAVRDGDGYRVNGRWRFNSGIPHAEWAIGGTVVESGAVGGPPEVIYTVFPKQDITLHDNWGDVVGLRGTGSCDFSVENYYLPKELTFVWNLMGSKPQRGGASYMFPPFSYVAKEHGPVVIGAARRALDELIKLATTTRGTFRPSRLDERQVVHRFIGQADLKLRSVRALLHERYDELYADINAGKMPDGAAVADVRATALYATDIAIDTVTQVYHFAGNTGLHHPHVIGRLMRDVNTAGLHQVMSDTAYENHGKFRLGLPADAMA
jgi:indole-3-acetate monooxygenase